MSPARRRLLAAGLLAGLLTLPLAAVLAPPDAVQGQAQRLMYLHVPAAWSAYLCFTMVTALSIRQLFRRDDAHLEEARAAAEIGVLLTGFTLVTGSIWGALTWGTWWAWDARVTSTVVMGLVYVAYLAAGGLAHGRRGRQAHAAIGAAGFLTVPLVHFSVLWWRTLHQPPTILAPSLDPPMELLMLLALGASMLTFSLLTVWAVNQRAATASWAQAAPTTGASTGASTPGSPGSPGSLGSSGSASEPRDETAAAQRAEQDRVR
ncbi:cytochrome c biogenesis protein CcsA [Nesterenkonia lutea]|uniref:Heme exporter protein C n=1 Tax=Nesterenkonia lutea TaxID=272919 RepID=A0ABR9JD82_9MICC|nr:cytochrome c biogenesis protein CcsA [Nesterenkonia lutea]MBE1523452.1 heme exporter protein C [Nesterenkonia lutea]